MRVRGGEEDLKLLVGGVGGGCRRGSLSVCIFCEQEAGRGAGEVYFMGELSGCE